MIEAPPPMSSRRPTTTPAQIRPSTSRTERPGVVVAEALVHTSVPSARYAPSRTRSPSAMRTPAGRRSRACAGTCRRRARRPPALEVGAGEVDVHRARSTGPRVVHATLARTPKRPSRLISAAGRAGARAGAAGGRRPRAVGGVAGVDHHEHRHAGSDLARDELGIPVDERTEDPQRVDVAVAVLAEEGVEADSA